MVLREEDPNKPSFVDIKSLLKDYQTILTELRVHVREENCDCSVRSLLERLEFNE